VNIYIYNREEQQIIKMTWIENINNIYKEQENMCELSLHNGKIIMLDTDKTYDKKYGTMLKTLDNQYISKKVINDKKNKLKWRHLYSFLPSDSIEMINHLIYKDIYKNKVLNIHRPITTRKLYENMNENILVNEKLSIEYINKNGDLTLKEENDIRNEESYEMIHIGEEENVMISKTRRNDNWININLCNMKSKNGKKCRCEYSKYIDIKKYGIYVKSLCHYTEEYYYNYDDRHRNKDGLDYKCSIRMCGKHLNKRKKNYNEMETIKKFYNDNGYDINKWGYCIKC
jgi:hypothetical protein